MTPEQELKVQIFDILQRQADITNAQQKLDQDRQELEQEKNLLLKKLKELKPLLPIQSRTTKDSNESIKQ